MTQEPLPVADVDAAPPPPAPREVTPRGSRRSWGEGRVRRWWLVALLMAVAGGYLVFTQVRASSRGRWLIEHGAKGTARVISADGQPTPGKRYAPDQANFRVEVRPETGEPFTFASRLEQHRGELKVGRPEETSFPIYFDPKDRSNFTTRTGYPLQDDLLVGLFLLPLVVLLLAGAVLTRMSVLRVWRNGEAVIAAVVETKQAASAPMSRVVRYTPRDARDNRVFATLVPNRLPLAAGDSFWLVAPPDRPDKGVVAALYQ